MKKILSLFLALVLCLSLCACGKAGDYKSAIALMDAGNFEEALAIFSELGDYEDSVQMLEQCRYNYAMVLIEQGEYAQSREQLELITMSEDVEKHLIRTAWGMLRVYLEENGSIGNEFKVENPTEKKEETTYSIRLASRNGALTIYTESYRYWRDTAGYEWAQSTTDGESITTFDESTGEVIQESDFHYNQDTSWTNPTNLDYEGVSRWNITDYYAEAPSVKEFTEIIEGQVNGELYEQQKMIIEFLSENLKELNLGLNIRDLGFSNY